MRESQVKNKIEVKKDDTNNWSVYNTDPNLYFTQVTSKFGTVLLVENTDRFDIIAVRNETLSAVFVDLNLDTSRVEIHDPFGKVAEFSFKVKADDVVAMIRSAKLDSQKGILAVSSARLVRGVTKSAETLARSKSVRNFLKAALTAFSTTVYFRAKVQEYIQDTQYDIKSYQKQILNTEDEIAKLKADINKFAASKKKLEKSFAESVSTSSSLNIQVKRFRNKKATS